MLLHRALCNVAAPRTSLSTSCPTAVGGAGVDTGGFIGIVAGWLQTVGYAQCCNGRLANLPAAGLLLLWGWGDRSAQGVCGCVCHMCCYVGGWVTRATAPSFAGECWLRYLNTLKSLAEQTLLLRSCPCGVPVHMQPLHDDTTMYAPRAPAPLPPRSSISSIHALTSQQ